MNIKSKLDHLISMAPQVSMLYIQTWNGWRQSTLSPGLGGSSEGCIIRSTKALPVTEPQDSDQREREREKGAQKDKAHIEKIKSRGAASLISSTKTLKHDYKEWAARTQCSHSSLFVVMLMLSYFSVIPIFHKYKLWIDATTCLARKSQRYKTNHQKLKLKSDF